jgi:hypothetical protein
MAAHPSKLDETAREQRIETRSQSPTTTATEAGETPLFRYSPAELEGLADRFAKEHGLENIQPDLRKGALLARDPSGYERYNLTEDEMTAVTDEIHHSVYTFFYHI